MHKSTETPAGPLDIAPVIIDGRLPYRIGSPLLPVLPVGTETHPIFPRFMELWPNITQVLRDEHLSVKFSGPAKRYRSDQDPSEVDYTVLIHVDMRLDDQQTRSIEAVKSIRQLLTQRGLTYPIEIIDIGAADVMITDIMTEGSLCALWPVMVDFILEEIDARQWTALDFVLRKMNRADVEASPTIVITAADADLEVWWNQHLPSIRTKLPQAVDVELLYSSSTCIAGSEATGQGSDRQHHSYITASAYEETVTMGASVALKGSTTDSSTVGCSIKLSAQKDVGAHFGLTNHHVVGDTTQQWHKNGWLGPSHHLNESKPLATMSPSDYDHQCFQEELKGAYWTTANASLVHGLGIDRGVTTSADRFLQSSPGRAYNVVKVGRTSGRTTGRINRVASVLNLRCDKSSIIPVDLVHRYKNVGLACGILSSRKDQDFIAGGDSGSVVLFDEEYGDEFTAYIVGLGFASNKATMISYMVPFDLVVRDIEMVTGRRVVEPVWEGDPRGTTPDSA